MVRAKVTQLRFYRNIPLYTRLGEMYALYKPAGITLSEMKTTREEFLGPLYLREEDKLKGLEETQGGLNRELKLEVSGGSLLRAKRILVNIVEETLSEPRSGSLEGLGETLEILLADRGSQFNMVDSLIDLAATCYSTTLHSINVMALALKFARYLDLGPGESKLLGLGGLLHDVGKTRIARHILVSPRKLTNPEFDEMKKHAIEGYNILAECSFNDNDLSRLALEHHEKIDGSGYPSGNRSPSYFAQILGLIDCYASLTTDDRPYRNKAKPFSALGVIRNDVIVGKYKSKLFEQFAYCLMQ